MGCFGLALVVEHFFGVPVVGEEEGGVSWKRNGKEEEEQGGGRGGGKEGEGGEGMGCTFGKKERKKKMVRVNRKLTHDLLSQTVYIPLFCKSHIPAQWPCPSP